jgi:cob(I)alamin adenosyltransferase
MRAKDHTGDPGMTNLLSGERVGKDHPRIEACGDVDELSSVLGALAAALPPSRHGLLREIQAIQGDLVRVGAFLATSPGSRAEAKLPGLGHERSGWLESAIAGMETALPPLDGFILPGGHPTAAWAQVSRAVCRRAERRAAALCPAGGEADGETAAVLAYLNRLSAYLFALARFCNSIHGIPDVPWKGPAGGML